MGKWASLAVLQGRHGEKVWKRFHHGSICPWAQSQTTWTFPLPWKTPGRANMFTCYVYKSTFNTVGHRQSCRWSQAQACCKGSSYRWRSMKVMHLDPYCLTQLHQGPLLHPHSGRHWSDQARIFRCTRRQTYWLRGFTSIYLNGMFYFSYIWVNIYIYIIGIFTQRFHSIVNNQTQGSTGPRKSSFGIHLGIRHRSEGTSNRLRRLRDFNRIDQNQQTNAPHTTFFQHRYVGQCFWPMFPGWFNFWRQFRCLKYA